MNYVEHTLKKHQFLHRFQYHTCLAYGGHGSTIQSLGLAQDRRHMACYLDVYGDLPHKWNVTP